MDISNLPPGVVDANLPGERQRDKELDDFLEWIEMILTKHTEVDLVDLKEVVLDMLNTYQ